MLIVNNIVSAASGRSRSSVCGYSNSGSSTVNPAVRITNGRCAHIEEGVGFGLPRIFQSFNIVSVFTTYNSGSQQLHGHVWSVLVSLLREAYVHSKLRGGVAVQLLAGTANRCVEIKLIFI